METGSGSTVAQTYIMQRLELLQQLPERLKPTNATSDSPRKDNLHQAAQKMTPLSFSFSVDCSFPARAVIAGLFLLCQSSGPSESGRQEQTQHLWPQSTAFNQHNKTQKYFSLKSKQSHSDLTSNKDWKEEGCGCPWTPRLPHFLHDGFIKLIIITGRFLTKGQFSVQDSSTVSKTPATFL